MCKLHKNDNSSIVRSKFQFLDLHIHMCKVYVLAVYVYEYDYRDISSLSKEVLISSM
jgi:hypothetical protein